jgi:GMP synthase (glutamine-hydrolysing)
MRPALIITHLEDHDGGLAQEELERAGQAVSQANALDGSRLPALEEVSAIVSLGGEMSAIGYEQDPFLSAEVELLRAALADDLPVLGMCLGAQLLAAASGGRISKLDRVYLGWPRLSRLSAADGDPLFAELTDGLPVLEWHEDVIDPPAEAVVLGTTETPGAALFRLGESAWGSQMHLEATPPMLLDGWLADGRSVAGARAAGYDVERFRAESREALPGQVGATRPIFAAFAALAARRNPATA